jgi:protein-disulfide isomerase
VYKNMVVHDVAMPAHLASCAAARQGKYLAFKSAFWDKGFTAFAASGGKDRSLLGADHVVSIARDVGLDAGKLKADMDGPACKQLVEADMAELAKFKVSGTPMFWINGVVIAGAAPKADFEQIIDERLKVAEASGVPGAQYYEREVLGKGEKKFVSKKDAAKK